MKVVVRGFFEKSGDTGKNRCLEATLSPISISGLLTENPLLMERK